MTSPLLALFVVSPSVLGDQTLCLFYLLTSVCVCFFIFSLYSRVSLKEPSALLAGHLAQADLLCNLSRTPTETHKH